MLDKHTINTMDVDQYRLVQTRAIHLTLSTGITSFSDSSNMTDTCTIKFFFFFLYVNKSLDINCIACDLHGRDKYIITTGCAALRVSRSHNSSSCKMCGVCDNETASRKEREKERGSHAHFNASSHHIHRHILCGIAESA